MLLSTLRLTWEELQKFGKYVYTINTAATSYLWDNVTHYDFTFRQLMHDKPWRSWSKTYMQGWNLALKDLISKSSTNYSGGQGTVNNQTFAVGNRRFGDWRDDCCWCFNKNRCKKTVQACHRCTYCGGWNYGFYNCRKRLGKQDNRDSSRSIKDQHQHQQDDDRWTPNKILWNKHCSSIFADNVCCYKLCY